MIRPAKPSDLAAVLAISRYSFTAPDDRFGAAWLISHLANPGVQLRVDAPGAGILRGFLITEKYPTGTLVRAIAVAHEFRGQGVGRGLIGTLRGPVSAWVRTENTASRSLFEGCGFAPSRHHGNVMKPRGDTTPDKPLTDAQQAIAALVWESGIASAVMSSLRLSLARYDELIGEMGVWVCEIIRDHGDEPADIRSFLFVSLRRRCLSWLRENGRRDRLLGKRVDECTIPQPGYCPDTSIFWGDAPAIRALLSARLKGGNNSRKAWEIKRELLNRLRRQHGAGNAEQQNA